MIGMDEFYIQSDQFFLKYETIQVNATIISIILVGMLKECTRVEKSLQKYKFMTPRHISGKGIRSTWRI